MVVQAPRILIVDDDDESSRRTRQVFGTKAVIQRRTVLHTVKSLFSINVESWSLIAFNSDSGQVRELQTIVRALYIKQQCPLVAFSSDLVSCIPLVNAGCGYECYQIALPQKIGKLLGI